MYIYTEASHLFRGAVFVARGLPCCEPLLCVYIYIHTRMIYLCMYKYIYIYIYISIYKQKSCVCVNIYAYTCLRVCVCIYTYMYVKHICITCFGVLCSRLGNFCVASLAYACTYIYTHA